MPNNSSDIDAILRPRPPRVVPAAFLFDQSEFAQSAARCFNRVRQDDFKKVVLAGAAGEAQQVVGQFFSSGFHQSIAPLTIMDDVAGWCVWFLSSEASQPAAFLSQLRSVGADRPGQFHHLLFLEVAQPADAETWTTKIASEKCLPLLLSKHGAMDRTSQDLARAATAYAYSGWKKYWEAGDANLATALSLPQDSRVLALGMGASELDVEYHAERWSQKILDALRNQMLDKIRKVDRPVLKGIKELLAFLLPDWYLATHEGGNPRGLEVVMGDESARIYYMDRTNRRPGITMFHRHLFQQLLVKLKDKFSFLAYIALANARRFVDRKSKALKEEIWPPIRDFLQLPEKPDSLLHVLAQRMKLCAEYAGTMQETQTSGEVPGGSFQQDYKTTWSRISAIPNLLGAFLRLALITIGLSGLILSPFWWGGIRHPLTDGVLRYVAAGSAGLLVVCLVGVLVHHYYACRVADYHVDLTETHIELRHLREVGGLAIKEIHKEGNELMKRMHDLAEKIDSLTVAVKKASVQAKRTAPSPASSFLTNDSIDVLLQPRVAELALRAYERLNEELTAKRQENGLVSFDPALWQTLLTRHTMAVCFDAISVLTFDECSRAMSPSAGQKEALVHNLFHEASQPAWNVHPDSDSPLICFSDPGQWREHCGQHDNVKFYKLNLKDMLMVSVIPLRKFA